MKLTGNQCQCPVCGEAFGTLSRFDAHRKGQMDNRKCLSVAEMEAKGWKKNPRGFWRGAGGYYGQVVCQS